MAGRSTKAASKAAKKVKAAKADKAPKQAKATDEKIKGAKPGGADRGPLAGTGHNLTEVKRILRPYAKRYNKLLDDKAEENGHYMRDARLLIEDAANELGCKTRLVRMALQDQRRVLKQEEKEKKMDQAELDQLVTMEDALSGTPLDEAAKAAAAKTNPAPKTPAKAKVTVTAKKAKPKANGTSTVVQMPAQQESKLALGEGDEGRPAAA